MVVIILMGLGVGVGLAAIVWGLFPPPLTLRAALARLSGEHVTAPTDVLTHGVGGARRLCGHLVEVNVRKVPQLADIVLPDLAITGTPTETFAVKVVGYGDRAGPARPGALGRQGASGCTPASRSPPSACWCSVGSARSRPFVDLHQAADRRRRHFCHSLSTYASLVSMAMAGAMGWSSALEVASTVSSTDWAMAEIAQSLLWAQAYRSNPGRASSDWPSASTSPTSPIWPGPWPRPVTGPASETPWRPRPTRSG